MDLSSPGAHCKWQVRIFASLIRFCRCNLCAFRVFFGRCHFFLFPQRFSRPRPFSSQVLRTRWMSGTGFFSLPCLTASRLSMLLIQRQSRSKEPIGDGGGGKPAHSKNWAKKKIFHLNRFRVLRSVFAADCIIAKKKSSTIKRQRIGSIPLLLAMVAAAAAVAQRGSLHTGETCFGVSLCSR